MKTHSFVLQPFPGYPSPPNCQITATITRDKNQLTLEYQIVGDLSQLLIPAQSDTPTRQHQLWESTCWEFFLSCPDSPQYWEFNLSPAGDWNVYRFCGYRQGMQEESAFTTLPFTVQELPENLTLTLTIDLSKIIQVNQGVKLGITSVIKDTNSNVSYWALTHPGAKPDFHLQKAWIVNL